MPSGAGRMVAAVNLPPQQMARAPCTPHHRHVTASTSDIPSASSLSALLTPLPPPPPSLLTFPPPVCQPCAILPSQSTRRPRQRRRQHSCAPVQGCRCRASRRTVGLCPQACVLHRWVRRNLQSEESAVREGKGGVGPSKVARRMTQ